MKRRFLLWLDTLPHKPKYLENKLKMSFWSDLCHIQKQKKQHQTKFDKKLQELEARLLKDISILKRGHLLEGYENTKVDMTKTKLSPVEANKKIIEMMKKDALYSEKEIHEHLVRLGLEKDVEHKWAETPKNEKPNAKIT